MTDLELDLRKLIADQQRTIRHQQREIDELRGAIDALMQPAPSELLSKNLAHPSRV